MSDFTLNAPKKDEDVNLLVTNADVLAAFNSAFDVEAASLSPKIVSWFINDAKRLGWTTVNATDDGFSLIYTAPVNKGRGRSCGCSDKTISLERFDYKPDDVSKTLHCVGMRIVDRSTRLDK